MSTSARWHSTSKFLETMLINSTSECSKLTEVAPCEDPCTHPACRNHVLFFSSPEKPLTVGLFWEQVHFWKLQPPHLPYWDPETRLLATQVGIDAHATDVMKFLWQLHDLTDSIDVLVRSVLLALHASVDPDVEKPEVAGGSLDDCSLGIAAAALHNAQLPYSASQPNWLEDWVSASRPAWHRAVKHLARLGSRLEARLDAAGATLERAGAGHCLNDDTSDPVLAFYVQRDLLDALREDPGKADKAREACSEPSLRGVHAELAALRKPLLQPNDVRKSTTGVYGWSSLATSAKETLKSLWPGGGGQADSSECAAASANVAPMRVRSSSISGRTPTLRRRNSLHLERSRSGSIAVPGPGKPRGAASRTWRRTTSTDAGSLAANTPEITMLPYYTDRAASALETTAEESNCRLAGLERGVQGLCLPVQEDDVGSVITHALLSRQCQEQTAAQWAAVTGGRSTCCPLARPCSGPWGDEMSCYASFPPALCRACSSPETPATSSTAAPALSSPRDSLPSMSSGLTDSPWKRLPGLTRSSWEEQWERQGVRSVLTALPQEQPIRVEFEDKEAKYSVAIHHAVQYHILRHWLCGDDLNFARSLYRCNRIKPSGGKSSAAFFVSHPDQRFLLKAVNRAEFKMLTTPSQAQAMFSYVDQVLFDKLPSVLAHVVGLFSVSVKLHKKSRESKPKHFIVQRNLRFSLQNQKRPHFVFDLKGVGNRKVRDVMPGAHGQAHADDSEAEAEPEAGQTASSTGGGRGGAVGRASKAVLWDMNLREWTDGKPLCLLSRDLKYLEAALHNDTYFLNKQSLVDYSLLLAAAEPPDDAGQGLEDEPGVLALGIIDWLRPYTWDKHMENVMKTLAQSGGPTVIEPPKYARRFLDAMGTVFVAETPAP